MEKSLVEHTKTLLKNEFHDEFLIDGYPVSFEDYVLHHSNGALLIKCVGETVQMATNSTNSIYRYQQYGLYEIRIIIQILLQKVKLRGKTDVEAVSDLTTRIKRALRTVLNNKILYYVGSSEASFDTRNRWYTRTVEFVFPYIKDVR
jgi:hypothetical protein